MCAINLFSNTPLNNHFEQHWLSLEELLYTTKISLTRCHFSSLVASSQPETCTFVAHRGLCCAFHCVNIYEKYYCILKVFCATVLIADLLCSCECSSCEGCSMCVKYKAVHITFNWVLIMQTQLAFAIFFFFFFLTFIVKLCFCYILVLNVGGLFNCFCFCRHFQLDQFCVLCLHLS